MAEFTLESLHAAASHMAGLEDFGNPSEYLPGLGKLLEELGPVTFQG